MGVSHRVQVPPFRMLEGGVFVRTNGHWTLVRGLSDVGQ